MRYVSLFSGIEAATVAWSPLGWTCAAVSEIEPFPCALLAHYYPDVPNLGDVTQITEAQIAALGRIDLLVFGSPCQDLSVAGKRAGLEGARSGLFLNAVTIIKWLRRHCGLRFALWENVPGAFSSNKGRDFAVVVGKLAGCGYVEVPPKGWGTEGAIVGKKGMVEWSTLDAQWFGVAQRRRRVFALADFGDWAGRPPVLLEPESLRGDFAPRREAGEDSTHDVAPCIGASGRGFERGGDTRGQDAVVAVGLLGSDIAETLRSHPRPGSNSVGSIVATTEISHCLNAGGMGRIDYETETLVTHSLRADGFDASEDGTGRGTPLIAAFTCSEQSNSFAREKEYSGALTAKPHSDSSNIQQGVRIGMQVRRLTPRECERLQGDADDYTLITYKRKPAADGPRYKALGNSMAVPVMRWIGQQLDLVDLF